MKIEDYPDVRALWEAEPGILLGVGDDEEGILRYLKRNPAMSLVALDGEILVGAILCGHDGRRGFLSHLTIRPDLRKEGIGKQLMTAAFSALKREGIEMALGIVLKSNKSGLAFTAKLGRNIADFAEVISFDLRDDDS
jgi:ribosomal protein S18 acetylase RimI-like enzyme